MAYKSTALVNNVQGGTNSGTFAINIRAVNLDTGSVANIPLDNLAANILDATLNGDIIGAVKDYFSLGALDGVRLL